MGLEADSNDIDELEEEHGQELTTDELMKLHCVSQQEVVEESLSEVEKVTGKQQSYGAIRERLKARQTFASYILRSMIIRQWLCALQIYLKIMGCRIFIKL
ncbi:hypothetical protein AVEN_19155-1 [Araneus ventricosus]|uniref:Uncharacterized protein n=1 Tax=Araneus ventricosus TaxID=182803 RepID=A0A4Y2PWD4_ARAVE|nr:hypothetical protein AVEN_19155-1 [Araneus ventricosus]